MSVDLHAHYTGALPTSFLYSTFLRRVKLHSDQIFLNQVNKVIEVKGPQLPERSIIQWLKTSPQNLGLLTTIEQPTNFQGFQETYRLIQLITKSTEVEENNFLLKAGSKAICHSYIKDGANGFSLRIGPRATEEATKQRLRATLEGFDSAKKEFSTEISSKITLTFIRKEDGTIKNMSEGGHFEELINLIKSNQSFRTNIDAFDFCGYESEDISQTLVSIRLLRESFPDKKIIVHIGEQFTDVDQKKLLQNIEELISVGIDRIGHGVILWCPDKYLSNESLDPVRRNLLQKIHSKKILLEICPTSNVMLTPIKKYSEINLEKLRNYGVIYSICTDNKAIFKTTLEKERSLVGERS